VDLIASRRMMPTANFRRTFFEGYRAFSGPVIHERHPTAVHYACHGCPIACKQKASREIPEYETLSHFGALNENADLESITRATALQRKRDGHHQRSSTIEMHGGDQSVRYTGHTWRTMSARSWG
jgi:aldehyde:ferredoxin oxidoreductase